MPDVKTILPDVRYASSFLDKKYKKYAELGEVIMDKITGEILVKRKADGRIISFVQNDKYLHDIMIELRILTKNNPQFTYPTTDESWFLSADFNVADITNTTLNVLRNEHMEFPDASLDERRRLQFNLSLDTNGFFIRPISRDTDKNIIEYLSNIYNIIFQDYSGDNADYLAEARKLRVSDYRVNNAQLKYTLTVSGTKNGENLIRGYSITKNIRINHETYVKLPTTYKNQFDTVTSLEVKVTEITYPKFDATMNYMENTENFDKTMYEKLIAPDNQIVIEHVNIMEFVDTGDQIPANSSVALIALVDGYSTAEYIGRVDKLANSAGYIPMAERPSGELWTTNNVWAEIISEIRIGGEKIETNHETVISDLEQFIYLSSGSRTKFTLDSTELTNIYFEIVSEVVNGGGNESEVTP